MPGRRKILPRDYSWLYFQDDFYSFNRVTEPTSMSKELIIDPCNEFSSYIISETTFQVDKDFDYKTKIPVLKSSSLESILQLPFIDPSCSYHVDYNIEPFVYPIQDTNYRISVKDTSRRVSFIRNLSCLGASSEFHYSDFQVILGNPKTLSLIGPTISQPLDTFLMAWLEIHLLRLMNLIQFARKKLISLLRLESIIMATFLCLIS